MSLAPGTMIESAGESFEIVEELGRGGMGVVYKALQRSMGRVVALKMLPSEMAQNENSMQRLVREARLNASLSHKNIVHIFSFNRSEDGQPFLVMEYIEGRTLADVLAEHKPLPAELFTHYFDQALAALERLHDEGLIHRDIKPANIMVTTDDTIKVMDLGIAKDLLGSKIQQAMTQTGALVGSPWYMSPEQCRGGSIDARSDLYSLGCVMYESLSGNPPFAGESAMEVMYKHAHDQVSTTGELNLPHHSALIMKAIAKEPSERFQTATEMRAALSSGADDVRPSRRSRASRKSKLSKTKLVIGMIALFAVALAVASQFGRMERQAHSSVPKKSINELYDRAADLTKLRMDPSCPADKKKAAEIEMERIFVELCGRADELNRNKVVFCFANLASLFVDRDPERAIKAYRTAVEAENTDMSSRGHLTINLLMLECKAGKFDQALQDYEKYSKYALNDYVEPDIPASLLQGKATALVGLRRPEEACAVWSVQNQFATTPKTKLIWMRKREEALRLLAMNGFTKVAVREYQKLIAEVQQFQKIIASSTLDPGDDENIPKKVQTLLADTYFRWGHALVQDRNWTELHDLETKLVSLNKNNPEHLGDIYMWFRQRAESNNDVKETLSCTRKAEDTYTQSAHPPERSLVPFGSEYWYCMNVRNYARASELMDKCIVLINNHPEYGAVQLPTHLALKGIALVRLHRYAEGEELLTEAESLTAQGNVHDPVNNLLSPLYQAELYDRVGNKEKAKHYYALVRSRCKDPEFIKLRPDIIKDELAQCDAFDKGVVTYQ